jgi:hypothetical protein
MHPSRVWSTVPFRDSVLNRGLLQTPSARGSRFGFVASMLTEGTDLTHVVAGGF